MDSQVGNDFFRNGLLWVQAVFFIFLVLNLVLTVIVIQLRKLSPNPELGQIRNLLASICPSIQLNLPIPLEIAGHILNIRINLIGILSPFHKLR